jgi:hypothetical protein
VGRAVIYHRQIAIACTTNNKDIKIQLKTLPVKEKKKKKKKKYFLFRE